MKKISILINEASKFVICLMMGLAIGLSAGCQSTEEGLHEINEFKTVTSTNRTEQIKIIVSVDWEGSHLKQENLDAMIKLRRDYPEVKLLHYLNAAYFTKPGADHESITRKIRSVLREGDEFGLHIHGWSSLFEAAGVTHKTTNKWTPLEYTFPTGTPCSYDCGHEIPITNYTTTELSMVIAYSVDLLQEMGFGRARSFRAGGWMSNDAVRSALVSNGFRTDSSAVPVDFIRDDLWIPGSKEFQLVPMLDQLWGNVYNSTSQPFYQTTSNGRILQIPDNGALADYMTANEMWQVIVDNYYAMQDDHNSEERYVMIGFHQESAAKFLPRLTPLVSHLRKYMGPNGVLTYADLPIFE